jgi:glucokinase
LNKVPVLDIGGSHVTGSLVDPASWSVVAGTSCRLPLDPHAPAKRIIETIAACASSVGPLSGKQLCVSIPGPFGYESGIARYCDVGKFDTLNGVDMRGALGHVLSKPPNDIAFANDAAAFTAGEWISGAGQDTERLVGITLGTGVGSTFLDHGRIMDSGSQVPPEGRVDLLTIDGRPLEDTVSTRAIVRATGSGAVGVQEVVQQARAGNQTAQRTLQNAYAALGKALAPWLVSYEADAVVVGGSIAYAWDMIGPSIRIGLEAAGVGVSLRKATHVDTAAQIGAAWLLRPQTDSAEPR